MLRFHTQTAGSSLTAQQPNLNVIRTTLQALAAVLGGTQSLHCNALDEALGLPTEEAAELALRTQQVIAYESGVAGTVDPFGGSYAMESLTSTIEEEAESLIARVDELGGALEAIEAGFIQRRIRDSAYAFQRRAESEETIVVRRESLPEQRAGTDRRLQGGSRGGEGAAVAGERASGEPRHPGGGGGAERG